jgi:hypothetical protein
MRCTDVNWDGGRIPTTFFREALTMAVEAIARRRPSSRTIAPAPLAGTRRRAGRPPPTKRGLRAP